MPNINTTQSAGLATQLKEYYDMNLLSRLLPNLVYLPFGQPRRMPAREGGTVNFRRFTALPQPTASLTEGVTPDGNLLTSEEITATPVQEGDYVKITDMVEFVAPDPILTITGELLGEQAAERLDSIVRDIVNAGTSVQYVGTGNTATDNILASDKLTVAEVTKAVRTLHNNKVRKLTSMINASTGIGTVPIPACFVAVIHPNTLYDLKSDSKFIPVEKYASTAALLPYEVGAADEVRFIMSHNTKVKTGLGEGGADVYCTMIFAADAFGVIYPQGVENIIKGFGAGDDPLNQRMTSGWKCLFTAKILQQLAMIRLEHGVTA